MMGKLLPKQPSLFAFDVNLELRIPCDHPLRAIKKRLDLRFVDALVEKTYGFSGHVSLPPEVIVRMLFLLFYYNIPSERQLCEELPYRLDFLWFLDMDLDSPVPHHSVLSKARSRWGAEIFRELFVRSVQQCVQAGLVSGELLHMDSTIIAANASKDSVIKTSPELVAALRQACQKQEQKLETLPATAPTDNTEAQLPLSAPTASSPATLSMVHQPQPVSSEAVAPPAQSTEPAAVALTILPQPAAESAAAPVEKLAVSKVPVNQTHVSLTDPEAELAPDKSGVTRLCYKEHRVVDDRCGVITALKVTGSTVADGTQLPGLYEAHRVHTQLAVPDGAIAGDKHYGTHRNYRYCTAEGLRPHLGQVRGSVEEKGLFAPQRFTYEPDQDQFRCPAGHVLVLHQRRPEIQSKTYQIERPELCEHCPLRSQCTRSKHGRSLKVAEDYQRITTALTEANSAAARRSRKRRRHVMEGSFADAMNNHGAKRARWRGRKRQEIQSWIIAAVQNLRILVGRDTEGPTRAQSAAQAGYRMENLTNFAKNTCQTMDLRRARWASVAPAFRREHLPPLPPFLPGRTYICRNCP
jgi:transposase